MGFFKRLLGLEQRPGETRPLRDESFEFEVLQSDIPSIVDFYSLICSPCQVMSGLLNEIGPDYIGKVNFFRLDVTKNPYTASRYNVSSVPTVIAYKKGKEAKRIVGLLHIDELRDWIDEIQ